ncbi:MAG: tetratricopeptide repeat protein [Bacteroidetes bacterium]|nr:MAG: tetratricopeptide repeat protein [Bacteroidota bacterium]
MSRLGNISNRGLINSLLMCVLLVFPAVLNAQSDKKYIRKGNREYEKNNFADSEVSYRKAIDKKKQSPDAVFNIGDALYKQNKFDDAGKQFIENISLNEGKKKKSAGLYNLGNSLLKSNKLKECIDAYKGSLKLRPDNSEAKYNLAYAQDLLKKQEEQKQKQQDKNKEDKKQDKNKEDQNKDQNDKNKDQQKDQKNSQDKQQKQQKQDQQQSISKDDAQRLLNALANDEKNVQEKVKLAKATKEKIRTVKNW